MPDILNIILSLQLGWAVSALLVSSSGTIKIKHVFKQPLQTSLSRITPPQLKHHIQLSRDYKSEGMSQQEKVGYFQ